MSALTDLIRAGFQRRQANLMIGAFQQVGGSGGGGGGSFGGVSTATHSGVAQAASGAGKRVTFSGWTFAPSTDGQPGPTLDASGTGFTPHDAGWYQLNCWLAFGFVAGSTALPGHLRLEISPFTDPDSLITEVPCAAVESDNGNGRSVYGVQTWLTSMVFYQPAAATVGANGLIPAVYFPGDAAACATWRTDLAPRLRVDVTKLG